MKIEWTGGLEEKLLDVSKNDKTRLVLGGKRIFATTDGTI
jgi:hypothetical protein